MTKTASPAAPSTKEFLEFSRACLSRCHEAEIELDEQLQILEDYAKTFSAWQAGLEQALEQAAFWPESERLCLQEIGAIHEKLLELAHVLRKDTLGERHKLRKKSEGILAYVDELPKSLSIFRTRKG